MYQQLDFSLQARSADQNDYVDKVVNVHYLVNTMEAVSEREAIRTVAELFHELLGQKVSVLESRDPNIDARLKVGNQAFFVQFKSSAVAASLDTAIRQLRTYANHHHGSIPIIAVPFMGEVGRQLCEQADIGWVDLSGNAHVTGPGLRLRIEGRPNRFKKRGRPSSPFAPMASRIARHLLINPKDSYSVRDLARATSMDPGFTSRLLTRLEQDQLIVRDPKGRVSVRDPGLLLDAWREDYDFSRNRVVKGHIAARSSESLLHDLTIGLTRRRIAHAATGLGAAWLYTNFAGFRVVTLYLKEALAAEHLKEIGFRDDSRGSNVWLVVPRDSGVFDGQSVFGGVNCVHPVQVYLDLKGQPERSKEAAENLRHLLLNWKQHG